MKRWRVTLVVFAALPVAGCSGIQSALDTHGPDAAAIAWLIWIFTGLCTLIWLAVMAALAIGLTRRAHEAAAPPLSREHYGAGRTRVITLFTVLTGLTVIALSVLSYLTDKSLATPAEQPAHVTITGRQWWWEIRYDDKDPSRSFTTANELHVPAGRPVMISLQSADVIHSFWVPSLAGKEDLIPGWRNSLTITAQAPGLYRGQCAEFCGLQHAHMGLLVFADPPDQFDRWYDAQVSATPPPPAAVAKGHDVFMRSGCILCHGIRGTRAGGKVGPDLTHLASRSTIAADTLALTHDNLVAWIRDPQAVKPGANMPKVNLSEPDRDAVARYLESLR